jgi:hypothetical protein
MWSANFPLNLPQPLEQARKRLTRVACVLLTISFCLSPVSFSSGNDIYGEEFPRLRTLSIATHNVSAVQMQIQDIPHQVGGHPGKKYKKYLVLLGASHHYPQLT